MKRILFIFISALFFIQCTTSTSNPDEPFLDNQHRKGGALPIIGKFDPETKTLDENHVIPAFSFMNQDSQIVNPETFSGKVYVADFFFIHCPTICPKVKANMKRIHDKFLKDDRVVLLSHSVDTYHDTIPALKAYSEKLEVQSGKWHFVTGKKAEIYQMADEYNSFAKEDPDAPGGFDHSGYIVLVDKNKHIRAVARGTDNEAVDRFMGDITKLLAEK